ncbi:amino acid adenylation domain-containing protein [Kitasatospora sp. NPDC050543]|uniref:amino acid adenylation domain-containing protein n=1 Tax=Kitasatospora sp. NPDC050543 TaxID=3364054 RepID=UPI0037928176
MDALTSPVRDNSGRGVVLCNSDEQYAIWPAEYPVPTGWRQVYGPAGRDACVAQVEELWTDLRPVRRGPPQGGPGTAQPTGQQPPHRSAHQSVYRLFRARAALAPDAVAVLADDSRLTYRELDRLSDRLALALRGLGVRAESVVPVCIDRSPDMVTALLAVLKAGGAFLPLDPAHPDLRLAQLVADCRCELLLTTRAHQGRFEGLRARAVAVEEYREPPGPPQAAGHAAQPSGHPAQPSGHPAQLPDDSAPEDAAYLIYTSGTTGTPKGVLVSHRSLAFTLARVAAAYELTPADRVLQLAALGFDTSLEQILATLTSGATLVLAGSHTWAPTELLHRLPTLGLTVADMTPAYWHHFLGLLPDDGPPPAGLRLVIVGGDTVHADDCRSSLRRLPGTRLVNAYGLTEAAITSTLCEVTPALLHTASTAPVPIGKPLPDARVHVLDTKLCPVRPGEKGEIYLGGPGVARGYWHRPGLTAELFLPDPYAVGAGERMYRTGDAGRWRPDGNLEILGRVDDQVKVRGYRVDPAEIEAVLAAHPAVRLARVTPVEQRGNGVALTAYYTLADRGGTDARARRDAIREYLAERLPDFMVPAELVLVDQMPLTPAGKIDRRRLPHTEPLVHRRGAGAAAGNGSAVESGVAELWSELLDVPDVGTEDDFFELGGNSLLAMEMLARARIMFGIDVTEIRFLTRSLLRDSSLRSFAEATRSARVGTHSTDGRAVDFAAEAELGVPVRRSALPSPDRKRPAQILLTGATGFCGAHLLKTLLTDTEARIHCLVRAPDEEHAWERIRAAQQRFLRHDLKDERVVPLVGDLTEPLLGLTESQFDTLADSLDAIHHLGGQVNFIYPYHQLRQANVGGTREVLRLAGRSRGIPVHYLSSLAVLAGFGPAGVGSVTESTPLDHADRLSVGYVESKWVAEALLHNAARAGLPVTILRTNDVTGDLATGVLNTSTEVCALIKYLADSGTCPDVRLLLDFVPADRFTRAVVHIAAHAPAGGEAYHLTSPRPAVLAVLAERLRARDYPVEELPYQQWVQGLVRFAAGHPTHPITPFVPLFVDRCPGTELSISEMYFRPTFPLFDRSNTVRALEGSGIELPAVDHGLLDLYLDQLQSSGYLAPAEVPDRRL